MSDVTDKLVIFEGEQEATAELATSNGRCDRCRGRMMFDAEGDAACFSCGNVVYRLPPLDINEPIHREPRRRFHAGIDIS